MTHEIKPTGWDESICADCGFPISQHATLYGTEDTDRENGSAVTEQGENR